MKVKELASPDAAAIGSAAGGELYGLDVLAEQLANQKENYSRFIMALEEESQISWRAPSSLLR
ncbi:prephenate dehydratase domain-containing protein [Aeromonas lusitana]|uniref:prephenate dehydratase domain-containing protein n=1 Tax=Aeromonas lusitana TaxID=931529 RepID=UPI003CC6399F